MNPTPYQTFMIWSSAAAAAFNGLAAIDTGDSTHLWMTVWFAATFVAFVAVTFQRDTIRT